MILLKNVSILFLLITSISLEGQSRFHSHSHIDTNFILKLDEVEINKHYFIEIHLSYQAKLDYTFSKYIIFFYQEDSISNIKLLRDEDNELRFQKLYIKENKQREWVLRFHQDLNHISDNSKLYVVVIKRLNADLKESLLKSDNTINNFDELLTYLNNLYCYVHGFDSILLE